MNAEQSGYAETNASIVRQEFGADQLEARGETAATAIAAAAKASIEARYILAMKRPRDWDTVRQRLLKECGRHGFAEAAIYRKPVGRKQNDNGEWEQQYVEGLSVRFAEAAIRTVTNFYSSATSIYDDPTKSILRVTVMDLESNATIETDVHVSKTVERSKLRSGQKPIAERVNSAGYKVYIVPATDDEVLNKTNALVSKALRNGVLRLLPGDIQDECEEKCRKVQVESDKADPEAAKKKLFDAFAAIGIMPDALKDYLGHSNELQPAELSKLRGIYSAIRDGETTWSAIMDGKQQPADGTKNEAAKKTEDLIAKHQAKAAEKKNKPAESKTTKDSPAADPAAGADGEPEPGANG